MSQAHKTLDALFAQLGLPSDEASISAFVAEHQALASEVELESAPWWSQAQASFLREAIADDAEWAEITGVLDTLLR